MDKHDGKVLVSKEIIGYALSKPVYSDKNVLLLPSGTVLTGNIIDKFIKMGIGTVCVYK